MLGFMKSIQQGLDPAMAEHQLNGLTPELRGQAYSIGVVLMEKNAPKHWCDVARRLLFVSERPYFDKS